MGATALMNSRSGFLTDIYPDLILLPRLKQLATSIRQRDSENKITSLQGNRPATGQFSAEINIIISEYQALKSQRRK